MAGNNNFAALKQHATKEYKFKQGRSIAELDPQKAATSDAINAVKLSSSEFDGIKKGMCAALAAHWLKEKLGSSSHPAFKGKSAGDAVHAGRNLETVSFNVPKFLAYAQSPSPEAILKQHGLEPSAKAADFQPMVTRSRIAEERHHNRDGSIRINRVSVVDTQVVESFVNACNVQFLKAGRGVYIAFKAKGRTLEKPGGGHAVAAYRSRGSTLYFFDPNCGVYAITDPAAFFRAFVACYDGIGYDVDFNTVQGSGFTYVDR